ncbi:hypothetical protein GQX73_g186 [Xylaria multiplex]|uniref:Ubiquitin 3 binding protein But2 C-terminal domain-containing protein n=1 Tax=Xylaria multiplex TaxID=323545 RepID=A0A7C8MTK8_9PEZI|nr:hypothetical protein GQX73_g186 [Xylaria multiplex]
MKPFIIPLFADILAHASTAIRPRQTDGSCCFGLTSVGVVKNEVKEDHLGELSLGGPFQQGGFCLDRSTKTIKDGLNHGCFMRAPNEQFQCYAGLVGATAFDISPTGKDGRSYLTYDNGVTTFWACPVGTDNDKYHYIFSSSTPDTTSCVAVALALYDLSAGCVSASNATVATPTSSASQSITSHWSTQVRERRSSANTVTAPTMPGYSQVPGAGLWSRMSPSESTSTGVVSKASSATASHTAKPSQICSISPSAPSVAPVKLGSLDKTAPDGIKDSSAEVSITSHNNTVFLYNIPSSFLPPVSDAKGSLCALQFRMPVCTELPKGYPCYHFSGLEQEFLANSGMNFDLILDDDEADWNGTALHQVFPGENTILGTFECGAPKGSYGARKMSWHVSSVRNFSLEFLHAGVGSDAKFQDGVGAWIVPCQ